MGRVVTKGSVRPFAPARWNRPCLLYTSNLYSSEVHINAGSRMDIHYSETAGKTDAKHTGTIVHIHGIADDKIGAISKIADPMEFMPDLLTTFAPYLLAYTCLLYTSRCV